LLPGQNLTVAGSADLPEGTQIFVIPHGALDYGPNEPSFVVDGRTTASGDLTFNLANDFDVRLNIDNQTLVNQDVDIFDGSRYLETINVAPGSFVVDRNYALEDSTQYNIITQSGAPVQQIGGTGGMSESELNLIGAILGGSGNQNTTTSTVINSDGSTSTNTVTTTTNIDGSTSTTVSNGEGFDGSIPLPPGVTGGGTTVGGTTIGGTGGDAADEIRRIDAEALALSGVIPESDDTEADALGQGVKDGFENLLTARDGLEKNGVFMGLPILPSFSGSTSVIAFSLPMAGQNYALNLDVSHPAFQVARLAELIGISLGFMFLTFKMFKI